MCLRRIIAKKTKQGKKNQVPTQRVREEGKGRHSRQSRSIGWDAVARFESIAKVREFGGERKQINTLISLHRRKERKKKLWSCASTLCSLRLAVRLERTVSLRG